MRPELVRARAELYRGWRSLRQLLPSILIGGLTGFALIGPVTHLFPGWAATPQAVALATTPPTSTPAASTTPTSCYVKNGPAPTGSRPAPAAPAAPSAIWVNVPLGVNVRVAPDPTSQRLTGLVQGARATVLGQRTGADGALWYNIQAPGQTTGWVNGTYVVTSPIYAATTGEGWSLMLPVGFGVTRTGPGAVEVRSADAGAVPFLELTASNASRSGPTAPLPVELRHDVPWVADHTDTLSVWDYQPSETVSRAPIDTCLVPDAAARQDGGWAWVTALSVGTTSRQYTFLFVSDRPADPLITQVLASVSLS